MSKEIIPIERIARAISMFRDQRVMLDSDLAALYGAPTGHLNRAVKRNASRFPPDFMFQLKSEELANLKCQIGISSWGGRRRTPPYVLNSERAVKVNIAIMRAFVKLRQMLDTHRELARKYSELERRVGKHDEETAGIIEAIRRLMKPPEKPRREIGFHVREKSARYRTRKVSIRHV